MRTKSIWNLLYLVILLCGLHWSTQNFAKSFAYNETALGSPLPFFNVYPFWDYVRWFIEFQDVQGIKPIFLYSSIPFLLSFLAVLGLVYLNQKHQPKSEIGTASWGTYEEMVVAGVFKKKATSICLGIYEERINKNSFYQFWKGIFKNATDPNYPYFRWLDKLYNILAFAKYFYNSEGKHTLMIASTGAGKGIGLVHPTLLDGWEESCIATDLKGELFNETSKYRKEKLGHYIFFFNPSEKGFSKWNPLNEIRWGTEYEGADIDNLAKVLIPKTSGDPFWSQNGQKLFRSIVTYLKYHDMKINQKETTLNDVIQFTAGQIRFVEVEGSLQQVAISVKQLMSEALNEEMLPVAVPVLDEQRNIMIQKEINSENISDILVLSRMSTEDTKNIHPTVLTGFSEALSMEEKLFQNFITVMNSELTVYNEKIVNDNTSSSDFSARDIMNLDRPVTLYIKIPPIDTDRLAPLLNLLVSFIISKNHVESDSNKLHTKGKGNKHKCLFLLDELANFGKIETLNHAISTARSAGMTFFTIFQGVNQIKEVYGKNENITNNCNYHIFMGVNENDTGKTISEALGKTTVELESRSRKNFFDTPSTTKSYQATDLLTVSEVRLEKDQITLITGTKPFKTPRNLYFLNPVLAERVGSVASVDRISKKFF